MEMQVISVEDVCRTCLKTNIKLTPIFGSLMIEMLKECASIQVRENDGLPGKLCNPCIETINNWWFFRQQMIVNNEKLLRLVEQKCKGCNQIGGGCLCIGGNNNILGANQMNQSNQGSTVNQVHQMNPINSINSINPINSINQMNSMNQISNQVTQMNQVTHVNQMTQDKGNQMVWYVSYDAGGNLCMQQSASGGVGGTSMGGGSQTVDETMSVGNSVEVVDNNVTVSLKESESLTDRLNEKSVASSNDVQPENICEVKIDVSNEEINEKPDYISLKNITHVPLENKVDKPLNNSAANICGCGVCDIVPHSCRTCGQKFDTKSELMSHSQKAHRDDTTIMQTPYSTFLNSHQKPITNPEKELYRCYFCGKTFKFNKSLKKHINTGHKDRTSFKCPFCYANFVDVIEGHNHARKCSPC